MGNKNQINVFQPQLGIEELNAVEKVFRRNWPGRGEECDNFESEFANYHKSNPAKFIATNSCSEAIFQILEHIGLKDFEIIMPTNSFVACANAAVNSGMKLVLCDVDEITGNPSLNDIQKVYTPETRVILVQHFGGIPTDVEPIAKWAKLNGIILIEDSAGALGSRTESGTICGLAGDFGVWSFDAMKMVVAGDGGMIYCANIEDAKTLRSRIYLGLTLESGIKANGKTNRWWEFQIETPGRRSIMNDITASIARIQLSKLDSNITSRKNNAEYYLTNLKHLKDIIFPIDDYFNLTCHYFFPLHFKNGKRDIVAKHLTDNGVYVTFRYFPIHKINYFGINQEFANSNRFQDNTLLIPQHSSLSVKDLERICIEIHNAMD